MGSLRERNRVLVVDALRRRGLASRSDLRPLDRAVADDRRQRRCRAPGAEGIVVEQRPPNGDGAGHPRPPARPAAARPRRRRRRRHRVRPRRGLGRARRPLVDGARRGAAARWTSTAPRPEAIGSRSRWCARAPGSRRGVDERPDHRRRASASPAPIDRRNGPDRLRGDPPRLGRPARARGAGPPRLGLYVEVDNDANLGALAEATFGAGRNLESIVYVMVGSGVGAGLVLDGRVHRGAAGLAGEIGHVQVRPGRRRLPLRQPGLPGDDRRRGCAARPPAPPARLRREHGPS